MNDKVEIDLDAIPQEKVDLLCAALLPGILEHFKDPENQRRFAEWQKERAEKRHALKSSP